MRVIGSGMKTGNTTDRLLERARHGDQQAFAALYDRFAGRLGEYVGTRIRSDAARRVDPEDIVQDVFADVFASLDRFVPRGKGSFFALLATIARRRMVDHYRRRSTVREKDDLSRAAGHASRRTGPLTRLVRSEERELRLRAFAALPEKAQRIIRLRLVERRSAREIAALTGTSEGAVWVWFRRAMAAWSKEVRRRSDT